MKPAVLSRKEGRAGRISLNGISNYHRLNEPMCRALLRALGEWHDDDSIKLIIIDAEKGTRGFCAGTDLVMLSQAGCALNNQVEAYFSSLYQLCAAISNYPKPIVTVMDGVVRSSGAGLALCGHYRVATERTSLSFPDTGYGFVPDAGATKFLADLDFEIGTWLALTGARIGGTEAVQFGLATHYCKSNQVSDLTAQLQHEGIEALQLRKQVSPAREMVELSEVAEMFQGECAKEIKYRLENASAWSNTQASKISAKSPIATRIALRQIRTGKYLNSVRDALMLEYRITTRIAKTREFREGVRAIMIDMDYCPHWRPKSLLTTNYDEVAKFFSPVGVRPLNLNEVVEPQSIDLAQMLA